MPMLTSGFLATVFLASDIASDLTSTKLRSP
jgi:hypothetical protein